MMVEELNRAVRWLNLTASPKEKGGPINPINEQERDNDTGNLPGFYDTKHTRYACMPTR